MEEESKDRKGTITGGGKFLSEDDGREIGHVLVPHSPLCMDVQAHTDALLCGRALLCLGEPGAHSGQGLSKYDSLIVWSKESEERGKGM